MGEVDPIKVFEIGQSLEDAFNNDSSSQTKEIRAFSTKSENTTCNKTPSENKNEATASISRNPLLKLIGNKKIVPSSLPTPSVNCKVNPPEASAPLPKCSLSPGTSSKSESAEEFCDDAIPVEIPNDIPEKFNNFMKRLGQAKALKTHKMKFMCKTPVEIVTIESPTMFWVRYPNNISHRISKDISLSLSVSPESQERNETDDLISLDEGWRPVEGECCISLSGNGTWKRSVVLDIISSVGVIKVFQVDEGKCEFIKREEVRQLPSEQSGNSPTFIHHPWQSFCCRLAGVRPGKKEGTFWNKESVRKFKSLLYKKKIWIQSVALPKDVETYSKESENLFCFPVNLFVMLEDGSFKSLNVTYCLESEGMAVMDKSSEVSGCQLDFYPSPFLSCILPIPDSIPTHQIKEIEYLYEWEEPPEIKTIYSGQRKEDKTYDKPIWVGANPTDPKLYRGPQIKEIEMEELHKEWLTSEGKLRFHMVGGGNPGDFYIYPIRKDDLRGEKRDEEMEALKRDLEKFYSMQSNQTEISHHRLNALASGERMFAVTVVENITDKRFGLWQRVELFPKEEMDNEGLQWRKERRENGVEYEFVNLRFQQPLNLVDCGGFIIRDTDKLLCIDERFTKVPRKAWRCRLLGIVGTERGGKFSQRAVELFQQTVKVDLEYEAYVMKKDSKGRSPRYHLLITEGKDKTRPVHEILLEEGLINQISD